MNATEHTVRSYRVATLLNMIGLAGICCSLLVAFYYQLVRFELPCPLCLLQRAGLLATGFGFLYNVRIGIRPLHYGFVLLGSVLTGVVATRQIFLHILPGDGGYGSTLLGLHLYCWGAIASVLTVIYVAILMMAGYSSFPEAQKTSSPFIFKITTLLFITLICGNVLSAILECGLGSCPANPLFYQLLH